MARSSTTARPGWSSSTIAVGASLAALGLPLLMQTAPAAQAWEPTKPNEF